MLSEKRLFHLRKSATTLCIVLSIALSSPPILSSAAERSYAREIGQYVDEDKVYLLENIRQNITLPSERTVVDALLCESGPEAIELFQKQLKEYPDPLLNTLSAARIAAYSRALYGTITPPKLSRPLPQAKPKLAEVQDTTKQQLTRIGKKQKNETVASLKPLPEKSKRDSLPPAPALSKKAKSETVASLKPLPEKPKRDSLPPAPALPKKAKSETIASLKPLQEKPKRDSLPPAPALQKKAKSETIASLKPLQEKPKQNTVPLPANLQEGSKQEATVVKNSGFTLQFGNFASKENAEALAQKVSLYEPAKTIQQGEFYKVISKNNYTSKEDVVDIVKKIPFIAVIVPAKVERR